MQILDGKLLAEKIRNELKEKINKENLSLCLAIIIVGNNPASEVYVKNKIKSCEEIGIKAILIRFDDDITQEKLIEKIHGLNNDNSVTGLIVQLPLPKHIFVPEIIKAINPYKDVDGFTAYNLGKMITSKDFEHLPPATPAGVIRLLDEYKINVEGMNVVVVGHSNIVGKPMSMMLVNRNATVTTCNIFTKDLNFYTKNADLIISATGVIKLIKKDMIKEGVIIVDVGITKDENGKICGDVDFENVSQECSFITPVPGGVGPMTIAQLLINTVNAKERQNLKIK